MTPEPQKNNTVLIIVAIIGVVGTIVASAIGAVGNYNTEKFRQEAELTRIALVTIATQGGATQMVLQNTVDAPTQTPYPTFTPNPTYTISPTNTLPPTIAATEFVPPADGILFQDNFDGGISSEWTPLSGNWIVSNGELTAFTEKTGAYIWISLQRPHWKNYILSLNINLPYQTTTWANYGAVSVRNSSSQSKIIGIPFGTKEIYWAFIGNKRSDDTPIAGQIPDAEYLSGSKLEIEVRGDIFVFRVNGRDVQSISISGYDSGGISLGAYCSPRGGCPSFDNVLVTYLP